MEIFFFSLLYIAALVLIIYLWVFIIKEIRKIAKEGKRNVAIWTVMAIVFSPFVTVTVLTCFEICRAIQETRNEKEMSKKAPMPLNECDNHVGFGTD